tara:strand:- start:5 stop:430 length:426 start_codon:yes stop_codon:yes gene_type:complete
MKKPTQLIAKELLQQFCDFYKERNLDGILSLLSTDVNMWGTGIDECRKGLDECKSQLLRDWSQSEYGQIIIDSFANFEDDACWAAAICHAIVKINGTEHKFEHLRGTITIKNENGHWKIRHMHSSFPDYRNNEASSFPSTN